MKNKISGNLLNIVFIAVIALLSYSAYSSDKKASYLKDKEQIKMENRRSTNFVPIVVWHTIRQGGSYSYNSDGTYTYRSNSGGGSSYGK